MCASRFLIDVCMMYVDVCMSSSPSIYCVARINQLKFSRARVDADADADGML